MEKERQKRGGEYGWKRNNGVAEYQLIVFSVIERYIDDTNHSPPKQEDRGYTSTLTTSPLYLSDSLKSQDQL